MAMLLCSKCFSAITAPLRFTRKESENGNYTYGLISANQKIQCPTEGCNGMPFEVDDLIFPLIR